MRTPVVLVTGVDAAPMAAATVSLQWDLPNVAVVRHDLDLHRGVLLRVVSDATGELDRAEIDLQHACVTCAIREDVVPTLHRLARLGHWSTLIAHLPLGAPADQVCGTLASDPRHARHLRVGAVVTALSHSVATDLLGDEVLRERDSSHGDDERGVGETLCGMVEYADIVVTGGEVDPTSAALLQTLSRPDADVVHDAAEVDTGPTLLTRHSHARTAAWCDPVAVPDPRSGTGVWQVLLTSPRGFHPGRLLDDLESLATGPHRARGTFWLPTRPGDALVWDGAGGQLSIGNQEPWGHRERHTRLLLTGVGSAPPSHLATAFESLLDTGDAPHPTGHLTEDGFEPWLGSLRETA